jgi:hypothetical protein
MDLTILSLLPVLLLASRVVPCGGAHHQAVRTQTNDFDERELPEQLMEAMVCCSSSFCRQSSLVCPAGLESQAV